MMNLSTITLSVAQGALQGKSFVFDSPAQCAMGRANDCDIRFADNYFHADVSRHHCVLEINPPAIRVRDLGSRNGTYVNGVRLEGPHHFSPDGRTEADTDAGCDLKNGDELRVGNTTFLVHVENAAGVPVPLFFV
jgi:pSer/pThr/pTyr-binding forkhead associated (FHA) protein